MAGLTWISLVMDSIIKVIVSPEYLTMDRTIDGKFVTIQKQLDLYFPIIWVLYIEHESK